MCRRGLSRSTTRGLESASVRHADGESVEQHENEDTRVSRSTPWKRMLRMWASICVATMEIEVPHNSPDSSWPMGTDVLLYSQCGVRLSFALAADIDPACVSRTEEAVEVRLDSPPTSSFDEDQQAQRESEKSKEHVEPSQDVTGLGSYEETRTHLTDLMQQYRVCQAKRRLVRRRIDIIRRRGGQHSAGSRGRRGTYAAGSTSSADTGSRRRSRAADLAEMEMLLEESQALRKSAQVIKHQINVAAFRYPSLDLQIDYRYCGWKRGSPAGQARQGPARSAGDSSETPAGSSTSIGGSDGVFRASAEALEETIETPSREMCGLRKARRLLLRGEEPASRRSAGVREAEDYGGAAASSETHVAALAQEIRQKSEQTAAVRVTRRDQLLLSMHSSTSWAAPTKTAGISIAGLANDPFSQESVEGGGSLQDSSDPAHRRRQRRGRTTAGYGPTGSGDRRRCGSSRRGIPGRKAGATRVGKSSDMGMGKSGDDDGASGETAYICRDLGVCWGVLPTTNTEIVSPLDSGGATKAATANSEFRATCCTRVQWPWVGVSPPQNSLNAELQTAQVLQVHVVQPPARVLIPTEPSASAAPGAFGTSADPVLTEGLLREVHPRPAARRNRRFPATPVRYTVEPPEPERAAAEAGTGPTTLDRFGMEEEETAVSAESALAKETAREPSTITTPELRLSPVTSALSPAATEDEGTSTTAGQPRRQQKASKFIRRLRRTKLGALRRGRTPYIMERAYVLASRQQGETGYATQLDQGTIPTLPRAGNVSIIPGMVSAPELLPSQTGESASDRTSQWPFVNLRQPLFLLTTAHESSAVPQPFVRPSGELVAPQSGSSSAEAPGPWMSAYTDYAVEPNSDREYAAAADGSNVGRRQ